MYNITKFLGCTCCCIFMQILSAPSCQFHLSNRLCYPHTQTPSCFSTRLCYTYILADFATILCGSCFLNHHCCIYLGMQRLVHTIGGGNRSLVGSPPPWTRDGGKWRGGLEFSLGRGLVGGGGRGSSRLLFSSSCRCNIYFLTQNTVIYVDFRFNLCPAHYSKGKQKKFRHETVQFRIYLPPRN